MKIKLNKWVRDIGNAGDEIDKPDDEAVALICKGVAQRVGGITRKKKAGVSTVTQQQDVPEFDDNDRPLNEPALKLAKEANDKQRTSDEESEAQASDHERADEGA